MSKTLTVNKSYKVGVPLKGFALKFYYVQVALFLLSISLVLNFLPNIIFPGPFVLKYVAMPVLLCAYFSIRGYKKLALTFYKYFWQNKHFRYVFVPLISIFLFEIVRYLIMGGYSIFLFIFVSLLMPLFVLFLVDVFVNYCDADVDLFMHKYVRSYFVLSNVIVLIAVLVFFLLKMHIIDAGAWSNVSMYGIDFQQRQAQEQNQYYSNPFFLTVILTDYIKFDNFFGEFGSFAGWSYEPHIACFFLTPAFLMIGYFEQSKKKKIALITAYILFYLLAFSTTALIGFAVAGFLYLVKLIFEKPVLFIRVLLGIAVLFLLIEIVAPAFFTDIYMYLFFKTASENTSANTSYTTIDYLMNPKTFFGNGLFVAPDIEDDVTFTSSRNLPANDIGFIPFIQLSCLYCVLFFYGIKKSLLSKHYTFLGLILIYIIFHGLKFPFHILSYPFIYLFYFLISIKESPKLAIKR